MQKENQFFIHEQVLFKLFDKEAQLNIFDIGACEGLSSLRYTSLFKNCNTYAFEPVPSNLEIIYKNKEANGLKNMSVFDIALSSEKGETVFHVSSGQPEDSANDGVDHGNKSSSLFAPGKAKEVFPWLKFDEEIKVKTDTLDNFCDENQIEAIDFIHMDVQGAELLVLKGAQKHLSKIKCVWLEVEKIALYEGQPLKEDIEIFFKENNFSRIINDVDHISGDQFWVNNDFIDKQSPEVKKYLKKLSKKSSYKSSLNLFVNKAKSKLRPRTRMRKLFSKGGE